VEGWLLGRIHFCIRPVQIVLLAFLCISQTLLTASETPKIKVALFFDKGARPRSNLPIALEAANDMTFSTVNGEELREGYLNNFDVLIVPGGSSKRESVSMEAEGRKEVRRFVEKGGIYLGICAGCYLLTQAKPTDLGLLPLDTLDKAHWRRGKGILPIRLTPLGQEIFGTKQNIIEVLYHNGPVIDDSHMTKDSNFKPLGFFQGELVQRGGKQGIMINTPAMFIGKFGKGLVMGISPHPEASRSQVYMELNAIRWLYAHRH